MRPEKAERNKRIVRDFKSGLTYRAIGEIYGISHPAIIQIVRRHLPEEERIRRGKIIHT